MNLRRISRREMVTFLVLLFSIAAFNFLFVEASIARISSLTLYNNGDFALYNHYFARTIALQPPLFDASQRISGFIYHFTPFLLLLAPIYAIHPTPTILPVMESMALSFAAIPLFLLARRRLGSDLIALAISTSYLLSPIVQYGLLDTFHEVSFVVPLFLWAVYSYVRKKYTICFLVFALAMTIREDLGFVISATGILMALQRGPKKLSYSMIVVGLVYTFIVSAFVLPQLSGGAPFFNSSRFEYLIKNPLGAVAGLIRPINFEYLVQLLTSVGFLPVISLEWLVPAIPVLMENLLSAGNGPEHQIVLSHYSLVVLPFLYLATLNAIGKLVRLVSRFESWSRYHRGVRKLSGKLPRRIVSISFISFLIISPVFMYNMLPPPIYQAWQSATSGQSEDNAVSVWKVMQSIPNEATVAADFQLLPIVSNQRQWRIFWLDAENRALPPVTGDFIITWTGADRPIQYRWFIAALLSGGEWTYIGSANGFSLLRNKTSPYRSTLEPDFLAIRIADKLDLRAGMKPVDSTQWKLHDDYLGVWYFSDPFARTPRNTIPESPNATITFEFTVTLAGKYCVYANVLWAPNRGTLYYSTNNGLWSIGIQPTSDSATWKVTYLGSSELLSGRNVITFMNGPPYASDGLQDLGFFSVVQVDGKCPAVQELNFV